MRQKKNFDKDSFKNISEWIHLEQENLTQLHKVLKTKELTNNSLKKTIIKNKVEKFRDFDFWFSVGSLIAEGFKPSDIAKYNSLLEFPIKNFNSIIKISIDLLNLNILNHKEKLNKRLKDLTEITEMSKGELLRFVKNSDFSIDESMLSQLKGNELKKSIGDHLNYLSQNVFPEILKELDKWVKNLTDVENQSIIKSIITRKFEIDGNYFDNNTYDYTDPVDYNNRGIFSLLHRWDEAQSHKAFGKISKHLEKIVVLYGGGMSKFRNVQELVYFNKINLKKDQKSSEWLLEAGICALKWREEVFNYDLKIKIPFLEKYTTYLGGWRIGIINC